MYYLIESICDPRKTTANNYWRLQEEVTSPNLSKCLQCSWNGFHFVTFVVRVVQNNLFNLAKLSAEILMNSRVFQSYRWRQFLLLINFPTSRLVNMIIFVKEAIVLFKQGWRGLLSGQQLNRLTTVSLAYDCIKSLRISNGLKYQNNGELDYTHGLLFCLPWLSNWIGLRMIPSCLNDNNRI